MSLGKIQRVLQKEIKRSPGKALVLFLLIPVALYFIVPLFWRFAPKSKNKNRPADAAEMLVEATELGPAAVMATTDWREMKRWIEQDQRMQSPELALARSPFLTFQERVARTAEPDEPDEEARPAAPATWEQLASQLTLSATLIGPRIRVATINGENYREMEELQPDGRDDESAEPLQLREIQETYVVLTRGGEEFQLPLTEPTDSGRIRIVRHD